MTGADHISHSTASTSMVVELAITGDLRFISHRDSMRMLHRAVVRAGLPVAYSQGFNPRLRLSLPLPRSVGMASCGDVVVLRLTDPRTATEVAAALGPQLPEGATVVDVRALPANHKPQLKTVTYTMQLAAPVDDDLQQRVAAFGAPRATNHHLGTWRPLVADVELHGTTLRWRTRFENGRTVSPKDLLTSLGLPCDHTMHTITRQNIEWK